MTKTRATFHLTPIAVWEAQRGESSYAPESFDREGFIHCTDGEERVIEVGNRYYTGDPRPYCLLTIDRERVVAPIVYEDPDNVYPHIYGPLNMDAVVAMRAVRRGADGRFIEIEDDVAEQ